MEESVRSKLFSFGLYGRPISELSKEELSELKNAPYVEILPESAVSTLRTKFTFKPLTSVSTMANTSSEKYIVRMSTQAWREYIFGPGVNITSKEYFYLIDFLLNRDDYVTAAEIRASVQIAPKTYFYICKKLKELGIVCEAKDGPLTNIKLNRIVDKAEMIRLPSFEEDLFRESEQIEASKIQLFSNTSLIEHIKLITRESSNGLDTKTLQRLTGIRPKTGLKLMQRIAGQETTEFCIVMETCHRSSICKLYARSAYESITRARISRISGKLAGDVEMGTISNEEKMAAIRFIAEKYGSFVLGRDIVKQVSELTGWAYSFDRKTLLNAAQSSGLHVTKTVIGRNKRYIISTKPLDPQDDKDGDEFASQAKDNERFKRQIKSRILLRSSQVKLDNGAALNIWAAYKDLLEAISKHFLSTGILLSSLVGRLPMKVFLSISNFTTPCLLYKAVYSLLKSNPEYFHNISQGLDTTRSIFCIQNSMELIRPGVIEIVDQLGSITVNEFLKFLPERLASVFRKKIQGKSIRTALKKLKKEGFIKLDSCNGFLCIKRGAIDGESTKMSKLISETKEKFHVPYNTRELIYRNLCQFGPDTSDDDQEAYVRKNFPDYIAEELYRSECIAIDKKDDKRKPKKVTVLPDGLRDLYLRVKGNIVKRHMYSINDPEEYSNDSDVGNVLGYLTHRRIVYARGSCIDAASCSLNQKFTKMFGQNLSPYKEYSSINESYYLVYFNRIYGLVKSCGSIDTIAILERLIYIESFELDKFFEVFKNVFYLQRLGGFTFVSLVDATDPFMCN